MSIQIFQVEKYITFNGNKYLIFNESKDLLLKQRVIFVVIKKGFLSSIIKFQNQLLIDYTDHFLLK